MKVDENGKLVPENREEAQMLIEAQQAEQEYQLRQQKEQQSRTKAATHQVRETDPAAKTHDGIHRTAGVGLLSDALIKAREQRAITKPRPSSNKGEQPPSLPLKEQAENPQNRITAAAKEILHAAVSGQKLNEVQERNSKILENRYPVISNALARNIEQNIGHGTRNTFK